MLVKKRKIATILCGALGALVIVLNAILIIFVSDYTMKSMQTESAVQCSQITNAYALAISNKVSEYLKWLSFYCDSDVALTGNVSDIILWLRSHASYRPPYFYHVSFVDLNGNSYSDVGGYENLSSSDVYREIIKNGYKEFVSNPTIDETTKKPVIYFARSVKAGGKIVGMFAAVVSLETLQNMVSYIQIGSTGRAWVIADDGVVISHKNDEYLMKKNLLDSDDDNPVIEAVKNIVVGGMGSEWIKSIDGDGLDLMCYSPVANTPWAFAMTVSASQINAAGKRLRIIMIVATFIVGLALIVVSTIIISVILTPLQKVNESINDIASGNADLTRRIEVVSNNEIAAVVEGFNAFTEKLHSIILGIKKSKETLSDAGEKLENCSENTSYSISEIIKNIENLGSHMGSQVLDVDDTAAAVHEIAENIQSLEKMITNQAESVLQANKSVEHMIENIASVGSSVEKMAESFSALEKNAADGASKQQDVNDKIMQIVQESEMLQEANAVISAIAEQTNLLAMNAAIEAAHAGEAGKGFSVVADEIRVLSETSNAQSMTIKEQLEKIKSSIDSVVTASADSSAMFNSVSEEIKKTDKLVRFIKDILQEQGADSNKISKVLRVMNDTTATVKSASGEMTAGNRSILQKIKNLQNATSGIKSIMGNINESIDAINTIGNSLVEITGEIKVSISGIGNQVDLFKI